MIKRIYFTLLAIAFVLFWSCWYAFAVNHGYDPNDRTVKWFERLVRPNKPPDSCCGKADAYEVGRYYRNAEGKMIAVIVNGEEKHFPDQTWRVPIADGTEIVVPENVINPYEDDLDNPTEKSWIFVALIGGYPYVYCFVRHPKGN